MTQLEKLKQEAREKYIDLAFTQTHQVGRDEAMEVVNRHGKQCDPNYHAECIEMIKDAREKAHDTHKEEHDQVTFYHFNEAELDEIVTTTYRQAVEDCVEIVDTLKIEGQNRHDNDKTEDTRDLLNDWLLPEIKVNITKALTNLTKHHE